VIWLAVPALAAAAYYALVLVAAARWKKTTKARMPVPPEKTTQAGMPVLLPVSILKPVYGRDPGFYEAIVSHATQDYPEFEILFGVKNPDDPALPDIERLRKEFPQLSISLHVVSTRALNAKVGVLEHLAARARYPILLVNDSDILVEPDYLRKVTAPLADPAVGLVTCLYRAAAQSWPSRAEALGIATDFAPSVLVARLLGVVEFALGSTMVFRAEGLRKIGGFSAIDAFLADDYQLSSEFVRHGYRIEFAPIVVETDLGSESFGGSWRHQLRWSRTIRVSRPAGYYGSIVTHATLWSLVAFAAHQWWAGALALGLRMIAGLRVGAGILKDPDVARYFWLIPIRDLFGSAVWLCGAFGHHVVWRGLRLRISPDGRICEQR
jgi:ceramide glucosyltransferase